MILEVRPDQSKAEAGKKKWSGTHSHMNIDPANDLQIFFNDHYQKGSQDIWKRKDVKNSLAVFAEVLNPLKNSSDDDKPKTRLIKMRIRIRRIGPIEPSNVDKPPDLDSELAD